MSRTFLDFSFQYFMWIFQFFVKFHIEQNHEFLMYERIKQFAKIFFDILFNSKKLLACAHLRAWCARILISYGNLKNKLSFHTQSEHSTDACKELSARQKSFFAVEKFMRYRAI